MSENDVVIVGLDNGHRNVKACAGKDKVMAAPAVVVEVTNALLEKESIKPTYVDETGKYLIGQDAVMYGNPNRPDLEATRFESPEYRITGLYALKTLGVKKAEIVCGAPVQFYAKYKDAMARSISNWKKSEDGYPHIIRARVFPEPFGAFADVWLSWDGTIQNAINQGTIGVVDIGANTLDLMEFREGKPTSNWHGEKEGVYRAYHRLYAALTSKWPDVAFEFHEMGKLLRDPTIKVYGKKVDVSGFVKSAKQAVVDSVKAAVKTAFKGGGHMDSIIFTGGGSVDLEEDLRGLYPHSQLPDDRVMANARGFYKLGRLAAARQSSKAD